MLLPLPRVMLEPMVRAALLEDLGRAGDITTDAIVPAGHRVTTGLVARQHGVISGLDLAALAFSLIEPGIEVLPERPDGSAVKPGGVVAAIRGPADGAELPVPPERDRHRHGLPRGGGAGPQGADRLHAQDDAGAAGV